VAGGSHDPVVVGVLYPSRFHADEASFAVEIERLRALDPRLEIVVEPYVDGSALRTRRSAPDFERGSVPEPDLTPRQRAALSRLDVALALDLPFDTPRVAPRLRWVQAVGSGIGQLRSAGLAGTGIRLTNAAGTSAPEIAEFVLARILEHHKRLPDLWVAQRRSSWQMLFGNGLTDRTIGLVGYGAINAEVARLACAFGMRVVVSRRHPSAGGELPGVAAVHPPEELAEMVADCDVVVAAVPETDDTIALFDRDLFAAMKPGAFFCNVGRGSAVVDDALVAALRSGHLAGAALDVFNQEPLPADHPYWRLPGLALSAYCSSVPVASIARVHELFRQNLARFLAGEALLNEVDLQIGY
jgi:phosphoglycerate dehydrogenase-like enzyme